MSSCPHCVAPINDVPVCPACQKPTVNSAKSGASLEVFAVQGLTSPPVCVCCGAEKAKDHPHKLYVDMRRFMWVQVGWCGPCRSTYIKGQIAVVVAMFALGFGLMVPPIALFGRNNTGYGLGLLGFFAGLLAGGLGVGKLLPHKPGHCEGCGAGVSTGLGALKGGRVGGTLQGCHRRFTDAWRQQNPS